MPRDPITVELIELDHSRTAELQATPGKVTIYRLDNGRTHVPGLIAPRDRERYACSVLEALAGQGDRQAAAALLAHVRWREEMRRGRPASKAQHEHTGTITVIDDLSPGRRAKRVLDVTPGEVKSLGSGEESLEEAAAPNPYEI